MPSPSPTSPSSPLTTLQNTLAQIKSTLSTTLPNPPNPPPASSSSSSSPNTTPTKIDPLSTLPPSITTLLPTRPAALIKLAHSKIHSHIYTAVPTCWMRLFTEGTLWEVIGVIEEGLRSTGEWEWVNEAVRLLDMAAIIAGAAGREGIVEGLLSALQDYVEERERGGDCGIVGEGMRLGCEGGGEEEDGGSVLGDGVGGNVPGIRRLVDTRTGMSLGGFERQLETGRPVVIQGAMDHWPALKERPWKSRAYLLKRTFGGRRLVPVEVGRSYTDEGWGQRIVTFGGFMEGYLFGGDEDNCMGYLAQHDLFTQIPSLRNDICTPDYCYTDPPPPAPGTPLATRSPMLKLEEPMLNAWFGPAGTVSPLHTDPYHNILCQVVGRKYVALYAPEESQKVYPKGVEGGGVDMSNTSEVDVENVDEQRWPLFKEAEYVECILEEGECLYIPVGWWHYVRSLTVSFSVSFWWN